MPLRSLPLLPLPGCPDARGGIRAGRGAGPLGRAGPQAARGRRVSPRARRSRLCPPPAARHAVRRVTASDRRGVSSVLYPARSSRGAGHRVTFGGSAHSGRALPPRADPGQATARCPGTVRERRAHGVRRVSARRAPPGAVRPGRSTRPSPASPCLAGVASVYGMVGV